MALGVESVRVSPGLGFVMLAVPSKERRIVQFGELLEGLHDRLDLISGGILPFIVGTNTKGEPLYADLAEMPHLLIAGTTGSGKSVMVNTIISSLLAWANPDEVQFVMVDMKQVELAAYAEVPHLLVPILTDRYEAQRALELLTGMMEARYAVLAGQSIKTIFDYNAMNEHQMPYIVVVVDELADLILRNPDAEAPIVLLAQKARAVGIHLILSTQRPTADVVTGLIKANVPSRMAFTVASELDSRIILDESGAETLTGHGDGLFSPIGQHRPERIQGAYISDEEIAAIVHRWSSNRDSYGNRQHVPEVDDSPPREAARD
jgi:S-DNA-T family DNA segregation ATPase FtsK/SpoIIIE